ADEGAESMAMLPLAAAQGFLRLIAVSFHGRHLVERPIARFARAVPKVLAAHRTQLAAHAIASPAVAKLLQRGQTDPAAPFALEVKPGSGDPSEVSHVTHVRRTEHRFEHEEHRDQPDGAKSNGRKDQHDGAVWPGQGIAEDHAIDRARGADGWDHPRQACEI